MLAVGRPNSKEVLSEKSPSLCRFGPSQNRGSLRRYSLPIVRLGCQGDFEIGLPVSDGAAEWFKPGSSRHVIPGMLCSTDPHLVIVCQPTTWWPCNRARRPR